MPAGSFCPYTVCASYQTERMRRLILAFAGRALETMSLREMGPKLKLPINVTNGSMPLQCKTCFQKFLPFKVSEHM